MAVEDDVDRLVFDTFFPGKADGVFIEVGAARPDYLSIGARFRQAGWKVIAIEPNPDFCAQHIANGHSVLEYACGDVDKDDVEFFVVDCKGAEYLGGKVTAESFSSLGIKDEFVGLFKRIEDKSTVKKIFVKVRRLDSIMAEHEPDVRKVDAMCVDVEGWELTVLKGFSLDKFKPSVVILENIFRRPDYSIFMEKAGYDLWLGLGLNEVYIRAEMKSAGVRAAAMRAGALHKLGALKNRVIAKIGKRFSGT